MLKGVDFIIEFYIQEIVWFLFLQLYGLFSLVVLSSFLQVYKCRNV